MSKYEFYKDNENDKIWWVEEIFENEDDFKYGEHLFSFDKVHIFNFFQDFPDKLTTEQIEIFKKENPILASLKVDVDYDENEHNNEENDDLLALLKE